MFNHSKLLTAISDVFPECHNLHSYLTDLCYLVGLSIGAKHTFAANILIFRSDAMYQSDRLRFG